MRIAGHDRDVTRLRERFPHVAQGLRVVVYDQDSCSVPPLLPHVRGCGSGG